jgi:hypothetical protein
VIGGYDAELIRARAITRAHAFAGDSDTNVQRPTGLRKATARQALNVQRAT